MVLQMIQTSSDRWFKYGPGDGSEYGPEDGSEYGPTDDWTLINRWFRIWTGRWLGIWSSHDSEYGPADGSEYDPTDDSGFDPTDNSGFDPLNHPSVIACGTFGLDETFDVIDGNVGIGENFLSDGIKNSASLSPGKYVLYLINETDSPISSAYQISLSPELIIPPIESGIFNEGELINFDLPAATSDEVTLNWTSYALPDGLILVVTLDP